MTTGTTSSTSSSSETLPSQPPREENEKGLPWIPVSIIGLLLLAAGAGIFFFLKSSMAPLPVAELIEGQPFNVVVDGREVEIQHEDWKGGKEIPHSNGPFTLPEKLPAPDLKAQVVKYLVITNPYNKEQVDLLPQQWKSGKKFPDITTGFSFILPENLPQPPKPPQPPVTPSDSASGDITLVPEPVQPKLEPEPKPEQPELVTTPDTGPADRPPEELQNEMRMRLKEANVPDVFSKTLQPALNKLTKQDVQFLYTATFPVGSFSLKGGQSELKKILDNSDIAEALKDDRARLYVLGYADSSGSTEYNAILTKNRANALKANLQKLLPNFHSHIYDFGMGATQLRENNEKSRVAELWYVCIPQDHVDDIAWLEENIQQILK